MMHHRPAQPNRTGALALGLVLTSTLIAPSAAAQLGAGDEAPTSAQERGDGWRSSDDEDGYSVSYFDDELSTTGTSPFGDLLKRRPPPRRALLIRARTSFVAETLKSVEGL